MARKQLMKKVNKILHTPKWLFLILLVGLILRIPSFFEPYSYGDEMIYLSLGEAIRRGVPLYSHIHDNKPPLLYIMAAIAGNLFWFKAILALWHSVTIFIFWKLSEALYKKKVLFQKIATTVFMILTTIPLLEGNIANAELFMIGPTMLAFYLLITKKHTPKNLVLSGVLFSMASLFKIPAAFEVPAIVFLWIIKEKQINTKSVKKIAVKTSYLALGFAGPILLTFIWYYFRGALKEYVIAAYLQNVGYLSSWRPDDVKEPFLVKNAPLLIRAGIVLLGSIVLYIKRNKLSKHFIFLTIWLLLTLFAVTLSERPYPHYLIQSVPIISLMVGMLVSFDSLEQVLVIIPLTITLVVPSYYNYWHYKTFPYYSRFVRFISGNMSVSEYLSSFGGHIPRNYKIAGYLGSSSKREDKVFVWGDSSMIYALSRRLPPGKYVADYHIKDFSSNKELVDVLNADMPEYFVVLPESSLFPDLRYLLSKNYSLMEIIDGAEIWKLLGTNIRSLLSKKY